MTFGDKISFAANTLSPKVLAMKNLSPKGPTIFFFFNKKFNFVAKSFSLNILFSDEIFLTPNVFYIIKSYLATKNFATKTILKKNSAAYSNEKVRCQKHF